MLFILFWQITLGLLQMDSAVFDLELTARILYDAKLTDAEAFRRPLCVAINTTICNNATIEKRSKLPPILFAFWGVWVGVLLKCVWCITCISKKWSKVFPSHPLPHQKQTKARSLLGYKGLDRELNKVELLMRAVARVPQVICLCCVVSSTYSRQESHPNPKP